MEAQPTTHTSAEPPSKDWAVRLFSKSVLKQRKLLEITQALGPTEGLDCLDLGSDNGVISYYLRERGGTWTSADLTQQSVDSIRSLVGERVVKLEGHTLPFPDNAFDRVVIVDMLEHIEDDQAFAKELARVTKPSGLLIVNVPNKKALSPLRGFRHLIGQTDEAHGHLRPGYRQGDLDTLFRNTFRFKSTKTYSRFFSEAIDTAIVFAYSLLSGKKHGAAEGEVSKGLVVTEQDVRAFEKKFRAYSRIYPVVAFVAKLDALVFFTPGFMRIAVAERTSAHADTTSP